MRKWKGTYIDLFGERLLLHERVIKDALDVNDYCESLPNQIDMHTDAYIKCVILLDALKFNFRFFKNPIKYFRLKYKLTRKYFFKHLPFSQLFKLSDQVQFDLEGMTKGTKDNSRVSREVMIGLVSGYSKVSWEDAEKLSVSDFVARLTQAINHMNAQRGGNFSLQSEVDKRTQLEREYDSIDWDSLNWQGRQN